jgi:putative FmdB family regulatory protein
VGASDFAGDFIATLRCLWNWDDALSLAHSFSPLLPPSGRRGGRARIYLLLYERVALPLYEYKCTKCGHRFEKIESVSASEIKKCPKCGARAERQLAPPAIQFKGTGWYVTDYAHKGSSNAANEGGGDGAAKKDPAKSDSKPGPASASDSSSSKDASKKKK